jgi:tRNA dimethylallyltransferase
MWAEGLVDEVRRLEGEGLREGVTASRALGYAQVLGVLDGRWDEAAPARRPWWRPAASPGGSGPGSAGTRG